MARVRIDRAQAQAFVSERTSALVSRVGRRTLNGAKSLVPVKTGETRASLGILMFKVTRNSVTMRIGSTLKKAHYLHEGTRRHTIRPTHKKALRFSSAGVVYVRAKVRHPGIGSTPYLTAALRAVAIPEGFIVERSLPARLRPREGTLTP